MHTKQRGPLSALAALALIVAACGSTPAASSASPTQAAASPTVAAASPTPAGPAKATPGQAVKMMLLPKFLGILPFAQANTGAQGAATELKIPSAKGESLFVAQVDFDQTGKVMAYMALKLMGADGGKFAILSASPDAANQNAWIKALNDALKDPKYAKLQLVDTVYDNDQSELSYTQAQALVAKYPDLKVIMAPTTVGIAAAAKAMQDGNLCNKVKVSGLGLPSEMVSYTLNGCAPQFALWSFVDLGYLTYYTSYLLATGAIKGVEGEQFVGGRLGTFTITKDPTRSAGLRVLMGGFKIYDKSNVEEIGRASCRERV